MFGISGCSASLDTACISTASRKRRSRARAPLAPQRRFHVHVAQRHEFGDAAGPLLQRAQALQMPRPVHGLLHVPEHDGGRRAQTHLVRGADDFQPFVGAQLVRADDGADLVIQNLGGRARQGREARIAQPLQIGRERQPSVLAPC